MSGITPAADGRLERSAATRRRILAAARTLLLAGTAEPTANEIADTAEITTRTLFRHFSDMESMFRSLIEDAEGQVNAVVTESMAQSHAGLSTEEMLDGIIERRSRVYESLLPLYISPIWVRYRGWGPKKVRQRIAREGRRAIVEALPTIAEGDGELFAAIEASLSIDYWVTLRRDQNLDAHKARNVLSRALGKLLQT